MDLTLPNESLHRRFECHTVIHVVTAILVVLTPFTRVSWVDLSAGTALEEAVVSNLYIDQRFLRVMLLAR